MGNNLDVFYNARQCHQCIFPCIRTCTYAGKPVWYNFDGMESVQPLVQLYRAHSGRRIKKFTGTLEELNYNEEISQQLQKGMAPAEQLAAICKYASEKGYRVRAVGTGSSWSRLTHTKDILIDMRDLNKILTRPPPTKKDVPSSVDIEVEGGMLVVDFVNKLDKKYGLALPMMGNYAGQTMAGVANTSTHGSGCFAGTLSTLVVGIHLIISGGIQVKIRDGDETITQVKEKVDAAKYGDEPLELNSTEVMRAVAVGLGTLGVIYSITYRCQPVYNIEENRTIKSIRWEGKDDFKVRHDFEEVFGDPTKGEFFSFFINPYPLGRPGKEVLDIAYLHGKRTERSPQCPAICACWCGPGGRGIGEISCMQTDCTASCLQGCAQCCPTCIPRITNFGLSQFSLRWPYVQKWYNVLQFTEGNIHVRTAEWCLPLTKLDEALGDVIELMQHYSENHKQYSLLPIYVRFAKGDDLYLSPATKIRPDGGSCDTYCYIEVPFLPGAYGIDEFQELVEDKLCTKFQARPHWGKNNRLNYHKVRQVYKLSQVEKWEEVAKIFNKHGTFNNAFTKNVGLDLCIMEQPTQ